MKVVLDKKPAEKRAPVVATPGTLLCLSGQADLFTFLRACTGTAAYNNQEGMPYNYDKRFFYMVKLSDGRIVRILKSRLSEGILLTAKITGSNADGAVTYTEGDVVDVAQDSQ